MDSHLDNEITSKLLQRVDSKLKFAIIYRSELAIFEDIDRNRMGLFSDDWPVCKIFENIFLCH